MKFWRLFPVLLLAATCSAFADETPEQFSERMKSTAGVQASVNRRQDGSLGSISIGMQPNLVAERAALEPVLADIGKFAVAARLKADVISPEHGDTDYIAGRLTAAGVKKVSTRVMHAGVSVQISRIFLSPDAPGTEKPAAAPQKKK